MKYLFFESEIDGFPLKMHSNHRKLRKPHIIRLTWGLFNEKGEILDLQDHLLRRNGGVQRQTAQITGITTSLLQLHGEDIEVVMQQFLNCVEWADELVTYNFNFEKTMLEQSLDESVIEAYFEKKNNTCLLKQAVTHEMRSNVKYKHYMSLSELYFSIFDKPCVLDRTPFSEVKVMANCYFELKKHKNEC